MNIDIFGNVIGYIGMAMVVYAFFMVQKATPNMLVYNIINLFSSICLFISLCIHTNIASMTLEIFWICGSIYGIMSAYKRKNKKNL